jgi:shikimate kinase
VFWLTASVPTITARIGRDNQRPSLTGTKSFVAEIEEVLAVRTPKYQAAADHTVPTDGCTIDHIVETILSSIRR